MKTEKKRGRPRHFVEVTPAYLAAVEDVAGFAAGFVDGGATVGIYRQFVKAIARFTKLDRADHVRDIP